MIFMKIKDRNGNKIEQGESFFYEDSVNDKVWMCQLDGDLVRCTDLEDYDQVNTFYIDQFKSHRAYFA